MTDVWGPGLAIAGATLVSEDLTCITAGLLIAEGRLNPAVGLAACAVGILCGDLGLWLAGRLLAAGARWQRWFPAAIRSPAMTGTADRLLRGAADVLDRRLAVAVMTSRAIPGTRLPLYVAAGAVGRRPLAFVAWAAVSVALWVPLFVLGIARFGDRIVGPLRTFLGVAWLVLPVAAVTILFGCRVAADLVTTDGRARLQARVARVWRWEFWPSWVFYAPVVPWIAWLALRHGGPGTLAAANPGIPEGGFVGESKFDILATLPADSVLPAFRLTPDSPEARLSALMRGMRERGWPFPVVLKPDVGQRGAGVRLVHDEREAAAYLSTLRSTAIAQLYHRGPFEAGVFYYRRPGEPRGHIFSMTDKRFPAVVGDGRATVASLIWRHPRYRMQAGRFLARLGTAGRRVPAAGEIVRLAFAGNHAQGTMFLDGTHLLTPALAQRVDEVARAIPGFFVGRFDIRYSSEEDFRQGRNLAIVELNGATSESTNIYDPSRSLWGAYATLFAQWRLVFEIGAANRRLGHDVVPVRRLLGLALTHLTTRNPLPVSD